jgi:hypothetical protein
VLVVDVELVAEVVEVSVLAPSVVELVVELPELASGQPLCWCVAVSVLAD